MIIKDRALKRIKALFPNKIKLLLKAIVGKAEIISYPRKSENLECPICEKKVHGFNTMDSNFLKKFDDFGFNYSIYHFETLNTFAYKCPKCGACDRERLYSLYLKNYLYKDKSAEFSMVDFAPSFIFSNHQKKQFPNVNYRSADLYQDYVDDKVDITDMHIYSNDQFDFLICSHILEHVKEDKIAIKELYRILKPNGKGIIMVPIMLSLNEDYEDDKIVSEIDRWKNYAQSDHVRLYSKSGFIKKLEDQGFTVNQCDINFFGKEEFINHGIHTRSVLYVVQK